MDTCGVILYLDRRKLAKAMEQEPETVDGRECVVLKVIHDIFPVKEEGEPYVTVIPDEEYYLPNSAERQRRETVVMAG